MINHGGPDPGIAHDYSHAFWTEERLMADQGHTDNRVMWFGPTPLIGDLDWAKDALFEMDRWLSAVEADRRAVPLAAKIAADKPADLTDRCQVEGFETVGTPAEPVCRMPELQTRLGTPRQVAGGPVANDTVACVTRAAGARRLRLRRRRAPGAVHRRASGPRSARSSPTASATGASPASGRGRPRPGCATTPATGRRSTAGATCPTCRPRPGPAGRARPSAGSCASRPAPGRWS